MKIETGLVLNPRHANDAKLYEDKSREYCRQLLELLSNLKQHIFYGDKHPAIKGMLAATVVPIAGVTPDPQLKATDKSLKDLIAAIELESAKLTEFAGYGGESL